ncbi:helix-hairpin-helix domain-containing protein [bacterium]|nr:helix-hairpin-helix domain-containing protein [bacterium]
MSQPTIPFPEPVPEGPEERNHNPYIVAAILALSVVVLLFYRLSGSQVVPQEQASSVGIPKTASNYIMVDVDGAVVRPGVYRLRVGSRVFDAIASAGGLKPDADRLQVKMAKKLRDEEKVIVPTVGQVLPTLSPTPAAEEESLDLPPELDEPEAPVDQPLPDLTPAAELTAEPVAVVTSTPKPEVTPKPKPETTPAAPSPVATAPPVPVVPATAKVSINRATADQLEGIPGLGPKLALDIVNYRKGPPPHAFTSLEELTQVPGLKQAKYDEILPYVKL